MHSTQLFSSQIPENTSKAFICNAEKFFAVKKQGELYIYKNSCPHIGVPLEWIEDQFLDSSRSMIQCANHGALFLIENGKCVSGPCSGQSLIAKKFTVENDEIFLID